MDGNFPILQALPVPALILSPDGRVLAGNADGVACFGQNGHALIGRNFKDLDLPTRDRALLEAFERAAGSGEAQEGLSLAGDRQHGLKVRIASARGQENVAKLVVTAESIPAVREWAEEVRRLKEELHERLHELMAAQRADEERKNFLAMLAHELRNPLAAVTN